MASQPIKRVRCEVYSRVVGYLSPVSRWNNGKKLEFKDRKTYLIDNVISEDEHS